MILIFLIEFDVCVCTCTCVRLHNSFTVSEGETLCIQNATYCDYKESEECAPVETQIP